ncbi:hypothetical protein Dimus_005271, partial [Dionaea muscipula]
AKNAEVPVDDNEAPAENVENVEVIEGQEVQQDFDWVQVEEDAEIQGEEQVEEEVKFGGTKKEKGCSGIFKIIESIPQDIFQTMS